MAQIINFQSYQGKERIRTAPAANGGAEILFFLGVRYERMPEPEAITLAASPVRAKRARKRRA